MIYNYFQMRFDCFSICFPQKRFKTLIFLVISMRFVSFKSSELPFISSVHCNIDETQIYQTKLLVAVMKFFERFFVKKT